MNNVSDQFKDEAENSSNKTSITRVEVWSGPTASSQPSYQETLGTVTAGSWSEDETRTPRRQAGLTVISAGIDLDDLVPNKPGSLLNPIPGNEIRLRSGFRYLNGKEELTGCGIYRMTKPASVDPGDQITITLTLNDRGWEISRRGWLEPYVISGSPTIDDAIHDAMDSRMPGLTYNLEPSTFTVPDTVLGAQVSGGKSDPMADFVTMCLAFGMELLFDPDAGVVTLRTVPDPTTSPLEAHFVEGDTLNLLEVDFTPDETQMFNTVVATGNGSGTAPAVQESVSVTDPDSLLNPATFGYVPKYITSPLITTSDQAIAAATAQLQTGLRAYDNTAFVGLGNPALCCGDALLLRRARLGVDNTYAASAITNNADPSQSQPMTVTNRARRSAA